MTSTVPAFGRRRPAAPAAPPSATPAALSASALAFKAELAASGRGGADEFAAWRKDQAAKRRLAWVATFALLTPGVLLFGLKAPAGVSAAVEVGGLVGSWWLRRERRRHLKAITDWKTEAEA